MGSDPRHATGAVSPDTLRAGRFVDPHGTPLLIGILSCEKYRERADGVRQSWLRLVPDTTQVLFLHGRPGGPEGIEGDILYLDVPETYEDLPLKVQRFLRYAVEHLAFDHVFKTDDDTYLDLPRFLGFERGSADYIGQFRTQPVGERGRTWHYGKCTDSAREVPWEGEFVCPWATGGGYFLSWRAAALAAERAEATCRAHLFEDMMVGEVLTRDPSLRVMMTEFRAMGVINPLLPKDMLHVQDLVLERESLIARLAQSEADNAGLRAMLAGGEGDAAIGAAGHPGAADDTASGARDALPAARVSVVMPVYNAAHWLAGSAGSVLAQSIPHLELICIDDGSTDDSAAVLDALAASDGRIRVLRNTANLGPSETRNRGIAAARGEFLFFMDADDSLPPDALERLVDACERSGCDLAMGAMDWRRAADEAPAELRSGELRVEDVATSPLLQRIPGSHCCNLYRRAAMARAGIAYATDLWLGEDQLFQAEAILAAGRVAVLDRVVYVYHHYRGGSLTRRAPSARLLRDDIEYVARIARAFVARGQPEPGWRLLGRWSWTIREHWERMPAAMSLAAASEVFDAFREMVSEFGVLPWTDATPLGHRRLLAAVLSGRDHDALRLLSSPELNSAAPMEAS